MIQAQNHNLHYQLFYYTRGFFNAIDFLSPLLAFKSVTFNTHSFHSRYFYHMSSIGSVDFTHGAKSNENHKDGQGNIKQEALTHDGNLTSSVIAKADHKDSQINIKREDSPQDGHSSHSINRLPDLFGTAKTYSASTNNVGHISPYGALPRCYQYPPRHDSPSRLSMQIIELQMTRNKVKLFLQTTPITQAILLNHVVAIRMLLTATHIINISQLSLHRFKCFL
ncbi:unnamed protein product [Ambrosiozyma monospora]|uniref:Unnamed protein product n=1 Tax=Ambrosiozyma monospora TaxID=43982 RepID=A0ACB5T503_AMBMO|nr:unnamed protein product [Ambrosiozyma monospora]